MNDSSWTLYLNIDDDQMAGVCLEALLGKTFEILAVGEGVAGMSLLENNSLDWVIVDFDLPGEHESEFIKTSGKLKPSHGFMKLSGLTVGIIAWERLHSRMSDWERLAMPMTVEEFLTRFPALAPAKDLQGVRK